MNTFLGRFLFVVFLAGMILSCGKKTSVNDLKPSEKKTSEVSSNSNVSNPSFSSQDLFLLESAIHLAVCYLEENYDSEGKFNYRTNTNSRVRVEPKYNILRHAGTIYALAEYYQTFKTNQKPEVLYQAVQFLKKNALAPVPGKPEMNAIWSDPKINYSGKALEAKLGGTGLGLVALLSVEKVIPGTSKIAELQMLGNFILFLQREDGSFVSKYIAHSKKKDVTWVSLYYPGEAALGLLFLYEFDPDPKWLKAAINALNFLAQQRKDQTTVEPDHWALLATEKLFNLKSSPPEIIIPVADLTRHAIQICRSLLPSKKDLQTQDILRLGFTLDGRTCPTATRLEGVFSALNGLPPKEFSSLSTNVFESVEIGIAFLRRSQILSGSHQGGIPRAVAPLTKDHPFFSTSFNERATEIRIDYVQHTLCAFLQYRKYILKK